MKKRTWMLSVTLLALPSFAWCDEKPTFDLSDAAVQKVIRAAAALPATAIVPGATSPRLPDQDLALPAIGENLVAIPFRAPRRFHHLDCDSFNCVAYTADGDALYSLPRDQHYGINSDKPEESWLACQSGNNLLTTFERYDLCRGVRIGIPGAELGNIVLNPPMLRL